MIAFSLLYFLTQNLAFLTMWFAGLARINVGVITTIWAVNPLFMAIIDSIIFKQKLLYYHYIGMFSIVACTLIISVSRLFEKDKTSFSEKEEISNILPSWIPALFGILTPVCFTASGILSKHLTGPRINFKASTLSFTSYLIVNIFIAIGAVIYWVHTNTFSFYLFIVGFLGSFLNTLGLTSI